MGSWNGQIVKLIFKCGTDEKENCVIFKRAGDVEVNGKYKACEQFLVSSDKRQ